MHFFEKALFLLNTSRLMICWWHLENHEKVKIQKREAQAWSACCVSCRCSYRSHGATMVQMLGIERAFVLVALIIVCLAHFRAFWHQEISWSSVLHTFTNMPTRRRRFSQWEENLLRCQKLRCHVDAVVQLRVTCAVLSGIPLSVPWLVHLIIEMDWIAIQKCLRRLTNNPGRRSRQTECPAPFDDFDLSAISMI